MSQIGSFELFLIYLLKNYHNILLSHKNIITKIEVLITIPMNPLENIIRIITHINIPKNPPNKI